MVNFLFNDNKPAQFAFSTKTQKTLPQHIRHLNCLSQFSTDIRYLIGNVVADPLSRIEALHTDNGINYKTLAPSRGSDEGRK